MADAIALYLVVASLGLESRRGRIRKIDLLPDAVLTNVSVAGHRSPHDKSPPQNERSFPACSVYRQEWPRSSSVVAQAHCPLSGARSPQRWMADRLAEPTTRSRCLQPSQALRPPQLPQSEDSRPLLPTKRWENLRCERAERKQRLWHRKSGRRPPDQRR